MSNFDSVNARAECSVANVFEALKLEVKQDVETRQTLRPEGRHYSFTFVTKGREFSAGVQGNKIYHAATFSIEDQVISVRNEDDEIMFNAVPILNEEGRCLLKIDDQEYERWQMRKMALGDLFFSSY